MVKKKYHILLLFLIFIVVRFLNLTSLPIFNDEAIYLHWGSFYFHNLNSPQTQLLAIDGKQTGVPLLYGASQFLPIDPLIAGRLATILLSLGTLIGGILLSNSILVGVLLTFCPFLLFYDRLALPDSIVTSAYTLSVVVLISLLGNPGIKKGILLGTIIAFGWWFKSTVLLIFPTIFIGARIYWSKFPERRKKLFFSIGACLITFAVLTSPLTLNAKYKYSSHKDTDRLTLTEVMENPQKVAINVWKISQWFISTTTPFVFIAFLIGVVVSILPQNQIIRGQNPLWGSRMDSIASQPPRKWPKDSSEVKESMKNFVLLSAVLFPVIFESIFLTNIMSRYILFITPVYLLLAAQGIMSLKKITKPYFIVTLTACIGLSLLLIFSPLNFYKFLGLFPAANADFAQYFRNWSSGYGVKEAVEFIVDKAKREKSIVFVTDDSGNPQDAMYAYLNRRDNFLVVPLSKYSEAPQFSRRFFVSRGPQYGILEGRLNELKKISKPLDFPEAEFIGVYEVREEF